MKPSEFAFCSWCFRETTHWLIENNAITRNVYQCSTCKQRTVECRLCKHMAKGGDWDDEFCAEHDGTIASFSRLDMRLGDISDFGHLFKRNVINAKKVGTIAAISIGGAAVLGPLAFAAAPALGGAVGTGLLGLSGAAAGSAGLAAIGGGAIAAGGLGMAGGAAIVGATGAALGGTLGGVISNSYFGDVEGFDIEFVKPGCEPKVIFIDGFLTQENLDLSEWKTALEKLYPENAWYYLRWESKRLHHIGNSIGGAAGKGAAEEIIKRWAKRAAKEAAKKLGPLGLAMSTLGLAANPWSIALVKAGQTGILLADLIARTDANYILCGHSLGARVIYYALENLRTKSRTCIDTVHLMGGAVGNNMIEWEMAKKAVSISLNNYYSENDWVLATLYKAGTYMLSTPIGRNKIDSTHPGINDYNVSGIVAGHTYYKEHFHKFAKT